MRGHIKDNPDMRRSYWRERDVGGVPAVEVQKSKPLPYEDVTQDWLDNVDPSKVGKVPELDYFEKNGKRFDSSNSNIVKGLSTKEYEMAKWIANTLHLDVESVPKIDKKSGSDCEAISSPDINIEGEGYWDIKTPNSSNPQVIYRNVRGKEKQSNQFSFDLDYSPITLQEAEKYSIDIFRRPDTQFVRKLMLKKGKYFKILEKA